jgi:hypothetical protein
VLLLGTLLMPVPASAASSTGGTRSHGVGFCIHAIAQDPSLIGVEHLGAEVSTEATAQPGAIAEALDEIRYPICGGPGAVE